MFPPRVSGKLLLLPIAHLAMVAVGAHIALTLASSVECVSHDGDSLSRRIVAASVDVGWICGKTACSFCIGSWVAITNSHVLTVAIFLVSLLYT